MTIPYFKALLDGLNKAHAGAAGVNLCIMTGFFCVFVMSFVKL